jgi:hypothetical protein
MPDIMHGLSRVAGSVFDVSLQYGGNNFLVPGYPLFPIITDCQTFHCQTKQRRLQAPAYVRQNRIAGYRCQ